MKKVLIYWFAFLIILLWMSSCASRKTQKKTSENIQNTTAHSEQKNDIVAIVKENQNVESITTKDQNSVTQIITITPIDATKPTTVTDSNGKTQIIQNGVYKNKSQTTNIKLKEENKAATSNGLTTVDKGSKKFDFDTKSKIKDSTKQTERTSLSWWFLLLIITLGALYGYWRIKK